MTKKQKPMKQAKKKAITITKTKEKKKNKSAKHTSQAKPKRQKGVSLFKIIPDNDNAQGDNEENPILNEASEQGQYEQIKQMSDQQIDQKHVAIGEEERDEEYERKEYEREERREEEDEREKEGKHEAEQQQVKEQEEEEQLQETTDISVIGLQIQETLSIISNVGKLGNGLPRSHYMSRLKQLLHQYYGYNHQLITHLLTFMHPIELVQFMESNETARPTSIRTNTLKTRRKELAQALIQRGVNLDPLAEWSSVGIKVYGSKVPLGATPEYLAGHYMLQSASSLLPVLALDPQPEERILDMAAAPGGKTTYIAQLMHNTGTLLANDVRKDRLKALQFNLHRMGVSNAAVTCEDGRKYPSYYSGMFDRVLLDAPCTGLGIIAKDPSIKANRVLLDIYKNAHLQKELLLAAIDCTKAGGVVVYSTCSVSYLENEDVVNYGLRKRFVKIVETKVEVGEEGLVKCGEKRYPAEMKMCRRIYPHVHNMDGFFLCKMVKLSKGIKHQISKGSKESQ